MTTDIKRTFAAGEVSPAVQARPDLVRGATGLRTCRNWLIRRTGVADNRPGTDFVAEVNNSLKRVKPVPFVFSSDQTYLLEFGDFYMRVIKNGAQVLEATKAITGISAALPAVVTSNAHGFSNGDEVVIAGVAGMTEVNGRNFKVVGVAANTFQLQYMDGTNVDSRGFGSYVSGGTAARVFTLASVYMEADFTELRFIQSADVMTVTHHLYDVRELARTGDTLWTLTTVTFTPAQAPPHGGTAGAGTGGGANYRYRATRVNIETKEESLPGRGPAFAISAATQTNPVRVTTAANPFITGDEVYIEGVVGMTQLNGRKFIITVISGTQFDLDLVDGTGFTAYSSGGTAARTFIAMYGVAGVAGNPITITLPATSETVEYNFYRRETLNATPTLPLTSDDVYGFIGIGGRIFVDGGVNQNLADKPPRDRNPFSGVGNFPSTAVYHKGSLYFANTDRNPDTIWKSRPGLFKNFTVNDGLQDGDSMTFPIRGKRVNEVLHLQDLGTLLAFSSEGVFSIPGDQDGVIRPAAVNPQQQTQRGSGLLPPLAVGGRAVYLDRLGSIVWDLGYQFDTSRYSGEDLTIFSSHLFEGHTIVDWAYQEHPNSIVWAVRDDGVLLGLTYVREHEIIAWHHHDFDGVVENVAVVPEGGVDRVYLVIRRTVNGRSVRYIERMHEREVEDIVDSVLMDCSLTFDGRNHDTTLKMTLSGGSTWGYTETLTLTASAAFFAAEMVGNEIQLTGADGKLIRFSIAAFTSPTIVTGKPHKTVPASLQTVATASWARAVKKVSGAWHIEGKAVSVFGDGFVVASPNNAAYVGRSVVNGEVTLDKAYAVIHVGLPVTADLEIPKLESAQGETLVDKRKKIGRATLELEKSLGLWAGAQAPESSSKYDAAHPDPLLGLFEVKARNSEGYEEPIDLATKSVSVRIQRGWNLHGRVFLRQVDPVPATILSIASAGSIPYR